MTDTEGSLIIATVGSVVLFLMFIWEAPYFAIGSFIPVFSALFFGHEGLLYLIERWERKQ